MRLNGTGEAIDGHRYPATSGELIDQYGEQTIELQNGSESLGAVLARVGSETFESADDVRETIRCGVGHEAVGRRHYSDRDAPAPGEDGPTQVSF